MNRVDYISWDLTTPGISFEKSWGRIRLFKSTLTAMSDPEYVRFLFTPEDRMFAVEPCSADDEGAYRLVHYGRDEYVEIRCKALVRFVYRSCGWNEKVSYRIAGEIYSPDSQLVFFDLLRAYEIHEGRVMEAKLQFSAQNMREDAKAETQDAGEYIIYEDILGAEVE